MLITGTSGNDTKNGTSGADTFNMTQGGTDTVNGEGGDDIFNFGAALNPGDKINGGNGNDTLNLNGAYSITFNATTITSVETINLHAGHDYAITTNNANVAAGATLTVDGSALGSANHLHFNGSAETNGKFVIHGGAGNDVLTGGRGADTFFDREGGNDHLNGGNGADTFNLGATLTSADRIAGGDGNDVLNITGDYTQASALVFGANTISSIQTIHLGNGHDYSITPMDEQWVSGEANAFRLTIDGSSLGSGDRLVVDAHKMNNTAVALKGGKGSDSFSFTDNFDTGSGDKIDGGGGTDTLNLNGDYSYLAFGASGLTSVENIVLGGGHSYDLVTSDANVAAGKTLSVDGSSLGASDSLTFDGSAETNGSFVLNGGAGDDVLMGGSRGDTFDLGSGGKDAVNGKGGNDIFNMGASLTGADSIDGYSGNDTVNIAGDYTGSNALKLTASTFLSVDELHLGAGHDYAITLADDESTDSNHLTVDASSLGSSNKLTLDATHLTDTQFRVLGGAGNDTITMGAVIANYVDGGGGSNTVILNGGPDLIVFFSGDLLNVQKIVLDAGHSYNIDFDQGNMAAGKTLTVDGSALGSGDSLIFAPLAGTVNHFQETGGAGNDQLDGSVASDTLTGNGGNDLFQPGGGGDTVSGGAGADSCVYEAGQTFGAGDSFNGGSGVDVLDLTGDYSAGLTLTGTMITSVEDIFVYGGYSYNFTIDPSAIAAGKTLDIDAGGDLGLTSPSDTLRVDGSALTASNLILYGGAGNDVLKGGGGADLFQGFGGADHLVSNGGADTFQYFAAAESTSTSYDTITGFDASADNFTLIFSVGAVDPKIASGALSTATFDSDMAAAVGASQLGIHHAVLFTPDSGDLAGSTFLIIDANGHAGYQAGKDLVIKLNNASHLGNLHANDFHVFSSP